MFGVYAGRFQPLHLGHQHIIQMMIDTHGIDNVLLVLGSVGLPQSEKNPLNYIQRKNLIKTIYPALSIVGIADVQTDNEWMAILEDLIYAKFGIGFEHVLFYGGSGDDTRYYLARNLHCQIIDRFTGEFGHISASIVRQRIQEKQNLQGWVDERIIDQIHPFWKYTLFQK